ncbi:cytosolic Fe-S cluster assembly factor NAR1 [Annulohypoxylon truncatum]|uniref:cytosolic Fe-S cluster assembly factor NAR1 n=1 Tax=Annulohypoxylon truncatum TaxID=327061 RepID=UPI002007AF8D|nr:cytosolic Fe-S cluster assembly factor NAR1 [Annulohypoxylon truncatum]KAI1209428.1 cytosolic Fe-S cluster assembly factor NAR1 [Annulohypoxylon truncatum]
MSAILSADDLNDFISPGVACIKPVETLPAAPPPPTDLEHEVILDGQPGAATNNTNAGPAQISLTDCLACSGCVTSAEAVLVSLQSHAELLSVLDGAPALRVRHNSTSDGGGKDGYVVEGLEDPAAKLFVASVSPQTRASLAAVAGRGVRERDAGNMVAQLLCGPAGLRAGGRYGNGFAWVVDTNAAREACLVLGAEEALRSANYDNNNNAENGIGNGNGNGNADGNRGNRLAKPVLTSSCPGWVCYAEKTHPYVLPHISRVKSPQALTGTLLKTVLSRTLGIPPDRIWHLAVMPCFDKKLEASREELTDVAWGGGGGGKPGKGVRDVDCVITSKEILMLTESRNIDFFGLPKAPVSSSLQTPFPDPTLQRFLFPVRPQKSQSDPTAGTSGGNLYYTLKYVSAQHPGSRIETIRGRNADVVEYTVNSADGKPIFKAARYYGFRNIQNLVRKLKPAKVSRMPGARTAGTRKPAGKQGGLEYAYVEVMACPGGCTNGGGQVKVDDPVVMERKGLESKPGPQEQKQWLAQVDEAYFSAEDSDVDSEIDFENTLAGNGGQAHEGGDMVGSISPAYIRDTLAHWASITGIEVDKLVYTSYREVVSDVGKDKEAGATERVVQLAGKIGGGW